MKKLIVIPAYNEEACILDTVETIKEQAKEFDYIVINDCSTDRTALLCKEHEIPVINLPYNLGIGGAVQTGYKYACQKGYDVVVQLDADGQHNPAYLDGMFKKMQEDNCDMVIGSRFIEKEGFQSTGMRRIGIRYLSFLIRVLMRKNITDPTSGLRMINKDLIAMFGNSYPTDYPEPESIISVLKRNKKIEEIPVIMHERKGGVSSINMRKSVYYMIKVSIMMVMERIR